MSFSFLGASCGAVRLEHRDALVAFLRERPHSLSGYTFAALFAYQGSFDYRWWFASPDALVISCVLEPGGDRHLLQPVGSVAPELVGKIVAGARELPYALRVIGVERAFIDANPEFVGHFDVVPEPENANYIYRAEDLARLRGRGYAKKRNLISQAEKLYEWTVEPLGGGNVAAAREVVREIQAEEPWRDTLILQQEIEALEVTLEHFADLQQDGVLVKVHGEPAGFAVFEAQSPDTGVIHYERALRRFKGLHQIVNQAAAKAILERGLTFVNREEDLGDPGLRRAKQSYNPVRLAEAFRLEFRR